jgi:hypothetical protein
MRCTNLKDRRPTTSTELVSAAFSPGLRIRGDLGRSLSLDRELSQKGEQASGRAIDPNFPQSLRTSNAQRSGGVKVDRVADTHDRLGPYVNAFRKLC